MCKVTIKTFVCRVTSFSNMTLKGYFFMKGSLGDFIGHKEDAEAYCLELLDNVVLCLKNPIEE